MERSKSEQIRKIPDILTKPFAEGVNPYTMMFLYLSYEQGTYNYLKDNLQRGIFDLYFTGSLSLEIQTNQRGRKNLEEEIKNGFRILRQHSSSEIKKIFTENKLPYFKKRDLIFVNNSDLETKKFNDALKSFKNKGKILSDEHKKKISEASFGKKHTDESKRKMTKAKIGKKQRPEHIAKRVEKMKEIFADPEYKKKISRKSKAIWKDKEFKRKMSEKRKGKKLKGEHKQKIGLGNKGKVRTSENKKILSEKAKIRWQDPEYRARVLEARRKSFEKKKGA